MDSQSRKLNGCAVKSSGLPPGREELFPPDLSDKDIDSHIKFAFSSKRNSSLGQTQRSRKKEPGS